MKKSAQLRNACLEAIDYCFGIDGDDDFLFDEMEFELQMRTANKPSVFKRVVFNAMVFAADMLSSL